MDGAGVAPNCLERVRVLDLPQLEANLLHRGAGVPRRRCCQSGRAEGRRARPSPRQRSAAGCRRILFPDLQANKKSTVDLKTDRGLALVEEITKRADVFVENFAQMAVSKVLRKANRGRGGNA
jgi:CoA-transferase family III